MKTILITGCSSGFGLETARHFLDRDWKVIAAMRTRARRYCPARRSCACFRSTSAMPRASATPSKPPGRSMRWSTTRGSAC